MAFGIMVGNKLDLATYKYEINHEGIPVHKSRSTS